MIDPFGPVELPTKTMKRVIAYELALALVYLAFVVYIVAGEAPQWMQPMSSAVLCGLTGGMGGVTYCLRGVYLNACVRKQWDADWLPWYFIRPLLSFVCGLASWVFLKAGLLVLESEQRPDAAQYAYFALAFIAGLNVDKFMAKLEDIAQAAWGIEKSRATKSTQESQESTDG